MADTKMQGYQLLMKEFGKNQTQAENLAKNVGNALIKLEMEDGIERPLAVFAAEVSGNPHYFDRGTIAGQLLLNGICYCHGREMPQSADEWRRLLLRVGIVPDNVSSIVHAYGLRLQTADGYHPAYDAFCKLREPYVITLENLKGIIGASAAGQKLYIVENEMVFTFLVNHVKENNVTILCTSGQLRTAALELIPLIIGSGATIYYSGDLDPKGIDIADRLWQKFGERIHLWRMTSKDYQKSCSNERITDVRLVKLDRVKNPVLRETAKRVKGKRVSAYQENILDDLLKDIGDKAVG